MQTVDSRKHLVRLKKCYFSLESLYFGGVGQESDDDRWQCLVSLLQLLSLKTLMSKGVLAHLAGGQEKCNNISGLSTSELQALAYELQEQIGASLPHVDCPMPSLMLPAEKRLAKLLQAVDAASGIIDGFDERFLGYLYQIFCQSSRAETLRSIQSANKKSNQAEIIAFTQLYTPDWAADYLIESCFSHKKSGDATELSQATLLDPACGAGHILLRAFDFFLKQYKRLNLDAKESVSRALGANIAGVDLDSRALWIAALSLRLKTLALGRMEPVPLSLHDVSNSLTPGLGTLEFEWPTNHPLMQKYDAVVANPPYLGRKLLDRDLKDLLRRHYPASYHDLSAAFLERGFSLLRQGGRLAFITQSSLLYLPSYGELRKKIIEERRLICVVELASQAFPLQSGEKVSSILLVAESSSAKETAPDHIGGSGLATFMDLRNAKDKPSALLTLVDQTDSPLIYRRRQEDFLLQRKQAFNYRCPPVLSRIFKEAKSLGDVADIRQGLATTNNAKFVRDLLDVPEAEIGKKWFPYVKGAGSVRWWSPVKNVVNWENNGQAIKEAVAASYPYLKGRIAWVVKNEQYYFKPGLTFSFVNSRQFAVRKLPEGCIFDVAGSALFMAEELRLPLLAYLNSSFISLCASILNPTVNFQVGDLKLLPMIDFSPALKETLEQIAGCALAIMKSFDRTPAFAGGGPDCFKQEQIAELQGLEEKLDQLVLEAVSSQFKLNAEEESILFDACRQEALKRMPVLPS